MNIYWSKKFIKSSLLFPIFFAFILCIQSDHVYAQNTQAEFLLRGSFGSMYMPCIKDALDNNTPADDFIKRKNTANYNVKTACVHINNNYSQGSNVTVSSNSFEAFSLQPDLQPIYETFRSASFNVGTFDKDGSNGYTCGAQAKCVSLKENNKYAEAVRYIYESGSDGTVGNPCLDYKNKRCCQGERCGSGWILDSSNPGGTCIDGSVCQNVISANNSPTPTRGPSPTPIPLASPLAGISPTAAPTEPPQKDCAGEIGCPCRRIIPGNDGLGIYGGAGENFKNGPLIGDVLKEYVLNTGASIANRLMGTGSQIPSDMAQPDNTEGMQQLMLFEYASACNAKAICARTRNIGLHLDPNNPPNIQGDDICVGADDLSWGSYVRSKGIESGYYANIAKKNGQNIASANILKVSTGQEDENVPGIGNKEKFDTEEIEVALAEMCIRQIPYSSKIIDTFGSSVLPPELLANINNEYTDSDDSFIQDIWAKFGDVFSGIGRDITKSMESSMGGTLFRFVIWGTNSIGKGFRSGIYANIVYGKSDDYANLRSRCTIDQSYTVTTTDGYSTKISIPPSCTSAPPTGKLGKDLIMNMDNEVIAQHGIPKDKVQGIKSSFAQCLDCAHEGKISTAIGCIPANNIQQFITETIFGIGVGIAGSFAILCIIYGAIIYQTSQGNSSQVQNAQKLIVNCLAGLLVIIFSLFILKFIGIDILRIPGLG